MVSMGQKGTRLRFVLMGSPSKNAETKGRAGQVGALGAALYGHMIVARPWLKGCNWKRALEVNWNSQQIGPASEPHTG